MTGRRAVVAAGLAAAAITLPSLALVSLTGCGPESPAAVPGPPRPGATGTSQAGANARVGAFVEVIGARIPAPAARAGRAEVAMALVNTDPGTKAELARASSPAARGAEFTHLGRVVSQITIPVSAGGALAVGPPHPYRLLLTGMAGQLRPGQVVTLTLAFARAGQVTLRVPVIG